MALNVIQGGHQFDIVHTSLPTNGMQQQCLSCTISKILPLL